MAEIINLRRERKRAERLKAGQQAAVNRLVHGRSKADRKFDAAQSDKAMTILDHHRIETETGDRQ